MLMQHNWSALYIMDKWPKFEIISSLSVSLLRIHRVKLRAQVCKVLLTPIILNEEVGYEMEQFSRFSYTWQWLKLLN